MGVGRPVRVCPRVGVGEASEVMAAGALAMQTPVWACEVTKSMPVQSPLWAQINRALRMPGRAWACTYTLCISRRIRSSRRRRRPHDRQVNRKRRLLAGRGYFLLVLQRPVPFSLVDELRL